MKTIKATPNHSRKTFTIRTYHNGKLTAKYRTIRMNSDEFQSNLHNTQNDWANYLKSDEYYIVK